MLVFIEFVWGVSPKTNTCTHSWTRLRVHSLTLTLFSWFMVSFYIMFALCQFMLTVGLNNALGCSAIFKIHSTLNSDKIVPRKIEDWMIGRENDNEQHSAKINTRLMYTAVIVTKLTPTRTTQHYTPEEHLSYITEVFHHYCVGCISY